ncbi:sugar ABC transporter permease [Paenibacillus sp. YN15]|uniref:ABC transporter permease n=1 Tax=Paenibacillus sp. YN15 TaxID=1742774 RepID=UPI000DCCED36|nr:ABC transporter permease subunit [Paenibacillus sp. YN15]RAU94700.1 sugar ABC transporter permease [Paenibacillus sp. YN15]
MRTKYTREWPLHVMLLPGVVLVLLFSYGPMLGLVMAFQQFVPTKGIWGSAFNGLDNFRYVLELPGIYQVLFNTVFIAVMKIAAGIAIPVGVALLLNELHRTWLKRGIQTLIYLPHFMSWIILGGILIDILSPSQGIVNQLLVKLGAEPIFFLGSNKWFPYVIVATHEWKEFGFSTIVYLAALTGINPSLYEAALMDGASRLKQTWHITLPGILPIVVLMSTLALGQVLNAGFDQIFNLYSPQVYKSGDILDTLVYRIGMLEAQYGVATAIGLFKSAVSFVLIVISYGMASRFANYRIF